MADKMTNREALENALVAAHAGVALTDGDTIAKLEHMAEMAAKRSTGTKVPTAKQRVNEDIKTSIVTLLANCETAFMSEIVACDERITTSQHATALVTQLVNDGRVERVKVGKSTAYRLRQSKRPERDGKPLKPKIWKSSR